MEVYIDDILVKSLKEADHIAHLEETFDSMQKYRTILNPSNASLGCHRASSLVS